MPKTLDLNGTWLVSWTEGLHGSPDHAGQTELDPGRYLEITVPGELHRVLQEARLIADPNVGLGSLAARWVEEQFWLYRRTFEAPPEALTQPAWLVFEGLDLNAVVFLNGVEVGRHGNAHRPCRIEVTGKLQPGENVLSVRLESGLYGVADKPGSDYATAPETLLNKRHWLRKAQYQCGWDWNPRLINVGLVGDVRLEWSDQPWIEQLVVYPEFLGGGPEAVLHVRAFVVSPCSGPTDGRLVLVLPEAACDVESRVTIEPGESRLDSLAWIGRPRLWWPVGHGEQPVARSPG